MVIPKSFVKHWLGTIFFISFFPQLVAGPIVKAHDFLPQVKLKKLREVDWDACFQQIIMGFFLKMVVADNIKDFTYWIAYPQFLRLDSVTLISMLFGYSCQIFADFAGYSLIAIGISRLFGYKLMANFNFPYISKSFREFWKRWHISLSTFLQLYLYIPLGGNRKGNIRTYLNLFVTMVLGGLWHGAAWSYAVWGAVHGVALAAERFIHSYYAPGKGMFVQASSIIFVFTIVSFAWLFFLLDFQHVLQFIGAVINNIDLQIHWRTPVNILAYSSFVFIYHALYLLRSNLNDRWIHNLKVFGYGFIIFLILSNAGIPGEFIYFQF